MLAITVNASDRQVSDGEHHPTSNINAYRKRNDRQPRRPVEIAPYRGLFPSPPLFDRMPTYRTQGKRSLNFLSASASQGTKQRRWRKGEVDVHAVYCPDTSACYFVPDTDVRKATITLRLTPPKVLRKDTMLASTYADPTAMFT